MCTHCFIHDGMHFQFVLIVVSVFLCVLHVVCLFVRIMNVNYMCEYIIYIDVGGGRREVVIDVFFVHVSLLLCV